MNTLSTNTLTLEDIRNLSDEVRLLVRAGLPLEQHLAAAGRGHGNRLQQTTQSIVDGLNNGQDLQSIINRESSSTSRMLASAVAAGVQSGDLATTVEMMGDFASDLVDLRKQIIHAISYPLIVLAVAWFLFSSFVMWQLDQIYESSIDLGIQFHPVLDRSLSLLTAHPEIVLALPAVAILILILWMLSGRASSMAFRGPERILLLLPGVGGLIRDMRFYTLTRMLSLLIERQVPLPDALQVAGATCGSVPLDEACQRAAKLITEGNASGIEGGTSWKHGQLPPLLQVCLKQTATEGNRMMLRLRAITQHYRTRLDFNTAWLKIVMPVVLFIVIAGGTAVLYAASVFWPVIEIYRQLGNMS